MSPLRVRTLERKKAIEFTRVVTSHEVVTTLPSFPPRFRFIPVYMTLAACGQADADDPPSDTDTHMSASGMSTPTTMPDASSATTTTAAESTTENPNTSTTDGPIASTTEGGESTDTTGANVDGWDAVVASCGLPTPCQQIVVDCLPDVVCGDTPEEQEYPDAMVCVFEQLAAGSELQFLAFFGNIVGEEEWFDAAAFADGTGVRQNGYESSETLEDSYDEPQRCTLQSTDWFQACLAAPVGDPVHNTCLDPYAWFLDDCRPTATCP